MKLKQWQAIKVDIKKVEAYDNVPPYIRLVKSVIKNAENHKPVIAEIDDNFVHIRTWRYDLLGDVGIPIEAIIE